MPLFLPIQQQNMVEQAVLDQGTVDTSAFQILKGGRVGRSQQLNPAAEYTHKRFTILLRCDFIHRYVVRPHGSKYSVDSLRLGAQGKHVHPFSSGQSGRKQLSPLVCHHNRILLRKDSGTVPQ